MMKNVFTCIKPIHAKNEKKQREERRTSTWEEEEKERRKGGQGGEGKGWTGLPEAKERRRRRQETDRDEKTTKMSQRVGYKPYPNWRQCMRTHLCQGKGAREESFHHVQHCSNWNACNKGQKRKRKVRLGTTSKTWLGLRGMLKCMHVTQN